MGNALSEMQNASGAVTGFETKIVALLEAFKTTAEDKLRLENELVEIKNYLKTATDANVELGNEIAELLGLANIPNYKKEEMGARHLAVLKAIIEAEKKAEAAAMVANTGEVKEDAGETKNN
jgi:sulfopyruvate decarboxylase TPP-binding subunit